MQESNSTEKKSQTDKVTCFDDLSEEAKRPVLMPKDSVLSHMQPLYNPSAKYEDFYGPAPVLPKVIWDIINEYDMSPDKVRFLEERYGIPVLDEYGFRTDVDIEPSDDHPEIMYRHIGKDLTFRHTVDDSDKLMAPEMVYRIVVFFFAAVGIFTVTNWLIEIFIRG